MDLGIIRKYKKDGTYDTEYVSSFFFLLMLTFDVNI